MTMLAAKGHVAGLPVVTAANYDGEEWQCVGCRKRFAAESILIAHVADKHRYLLKGENPR